MKRAEFGRLIDTIFAANAGEELSCSDYFEQLPHYAELQAAGKDAAARLPAVRHHMHQCPECEEVYLGLLEVLLAGNKSDASK
ncbi:hypothetical protein WOC76_04010 [Methylocystis sp. IM3]|jgi:hypothetical protein|uniref:hypothetical protein n=1 Tax=unclassified Methylocystis TaxID=2625913 RepID=UPI000F999447|nr:MAG: hypothetical protein EKK29_22000 [Hyphomicrobiales bacterium]